MPRTPKPMSTKEHAQLERRTASARNTGRLTQSFFVPGGEERPNIEFSVERTGRQGLDGKYIYEVKLDLDGFNLGERAVPPGLTLAAVTKRLPQKVVAENAHLLEGFIPDHLAF